MAGLVLRLIGIWSDLPYGFLHIDEGFHLTSAFNMAQERTVKPFDLVYPTGFAVVLIPTFTAFYAAGAVVGHFKGLDDLIYQYLIAPGQFFVAGRVLIVLLGASTGVVAYVAAKKAFGQLAALLAASFITFSYLHVQYSHYLLPEVQVTFLVTVCIALLLSHIRSGSVWSLAAAGIVAGLATSTKQSGAPLAVAVVAAWWLAETPSGQAGLRSRLSGRRLASLAVSGVAALLAFAATSPAYMLDLAGSFEANRGSLEEGGLGLLRTGKVGLFDGPMYVWPFQMWLWADWGLAGVGFAGLVYAGIRRTSQDIILLSFVVPFLLIAAAFTVHQITYVVPLVPTLLILGGRVCAETITKLGSLKRTLAVAAVAAIVISTGLKAVAFDFVLTGQDTRLQARDWIEQNIAPLSHLAVTNPAYSPPLYDPESQRLQGETARTDPEVRDRLRSFFSTSVYYRVTEKIAGANGMLKPPEALAAEGIEYLVVSSYATDPVLKFPAPPPGHVLRPEYDRERAYWGSIRESPALTVMAEFKPNWRNPGPTITIYRVSADSTAHLNGAPDFAPPTSVGGLRPAHQCRVGLALPSYA
jgi:hypothetical protein